MLALAVLAALPAQAAPLRLDLARSLELARAHSATLMDRRDELSAAGHRVRSAQARLLPQLKVSARYTRLSYVAPAQLELPFRIPNQPAPEPLVLGEPIEDQYGFRVALEQPLFKGFSLLRGVDAAREGEALARARLALEEADLQVVVEEGYLGLWQAQQLAQVARESVRVLEAHEASTASLRAQGQVTRWEQDRVRARVASARAQLLQAESAAHLARLSLVELLGLPDDQELELAEAGLPSVETGAVDALVARALGARAELSVARAQANVRRAQAAASFGGLYPQLRLAASYGIESPNPRYFPPENVARDSWDASVLLQWTVVDFGGGWHAAQAAALDARVAERSLTQLETRVRLEVERRHAEVRTTAPRLEAADLAVAAAEGALARAQSLCAQGQASCTGVLEAELELTRARAERTQTVANARLAAVRLQRSIGGSER